MHSFSGNLVGTGRLSLIHQDTAVRRVGNKKRPQVEPAALWYKRRNKSNKRKPRLTRLGDIYKARTPRYERQDAEVALMTVDGTYGGRGILRGAGNNAAAQDHKSHDGVTPPSVVVFIRPTRRRLPREKSEVIVRGRRRTIWTGDSGKGRGGGLRRIRIGRIGDR